MTIRTRDKLLGIRVDDELLKQLDEAVARVRAERRGCNFSRSDYVRELLWEVLRQRRETISRTSG